MSEIDNLLVKQANGLLSPKERERLAELCQPKPAKPPAKRKASHGRR